MKISLIITTKNEEDTIGRLMDSILLQTRLPNELVIVDSKSTDKTVEIIKTKLKASRIPLEIISDECNIAKGRNIAIRKAKNEYIAVTDGGCQLDTNWLRELEIEMLKSKNEVIYGASKAVGRTLIGKCFSLLHMAKTTSKKLTSTEFSSRSLLMTKAAWKDVNGYPEWLTLAGEDTHFFIALNKKFTYSYAPDAICYWYHGNEDLHMIFKMHYRNSIGSGESSMWSLRYASLLGIYVFLGILGILSFVNIYALIIFLVALTTFTSRFSYSAYKASHNLNTLFIMPILCFFRDLGLLAGYIQGFAIRHKISLKKHFDFWLYAGILILFNIFSIANNTIFAKTLIVIFLTVAPGLLILKTLKIHTENLLENISLASGLSILYLYVLSLITNWLTPILTNVLPFSHLALLSYINLSYLALLVTSFKLDKSVLQKYPALNISLSQIDLTIILTSLFFPIFSIIGASSLNNGGSNIFTLIGLLGVGLYILLVSIIRKHLSESVFPILLYIFCFTFLLAISLRGWNISGHDILSEYRVFRLTEGNLKWDISIFRDAYNACLSITTLPTIFNSFLGLNEYIFRLVFQAIFSIAPVALYFLMKKFVKPFIAFLSVIFFMSQSPFLRDFPYLVRQEIAILFYVLSLLVLFSNLPKKRKTIIFLAFSMGITLSHYTTAYFAIAIYILAYLLEKTLVLISKYFNNKNLNNHLLRNLFENTKKFNLSFFMVILPLVFTILWYQIYTKTTSNLSDFLKETTNGVHQIFKFENSRGKNSIFDQFKLYNEFGSTKELVNAYQKSEAAALSSDKYLNSYEANTYGDYSPLNETSILLPQKIDPSISNLIYGVGEIIKKFMKIFMLIGVGYFFIKLFKREDLPSDFAILVACNLLLLFISIIIPFLSIDYDLMRAYQQMLVVLALPTVMGCMLLLEKVFKQRQIFVTTFIFVIYYLYISPFVPQVIGEGFAHLQLNNFGLYYNIYYVHDTELASIKWISQYGDSNTRTNSDWYSGKKIVTFSNRPIWINDTVLPQGISKNDYVYSNFVNTKQGIAYTFYRGELQYQYPTSFLDANKDVIYNNGYTRIYK